MDYKIKYAEETFEELDQIFNFVAKVSEDGARNVIRRIRSKINALQFLPGGFDFDARLGRKLHDELKTEAIISDDYLILFVVDENKKEVIITHVIPSKSDYMQLLK